MWARLEKNGKSGLVAVQLTVPLVIFFLLKQFINMNLCSFSDLEFIVTMFERFDLLY